MKKFLLISGAIALSLVGVVFVIQAARPVHEDSEGREYVHKGRGPISGSLNKIFTGSNRDYLNNGRPGRKYEDGDRGPRGNIRNQR